MTGSGAFAGRFALDYVYGLTDRSGKRFDEELVRIGYKGSALAAPQRFAGYFELHIEQGPVLETEGLEIGVVTGVQGMRWFDVEFSGDCCHAGTTPMALRRDPVPAVAAFLAEVNAIGDMDRGRSLCTVGLLEAAPGSRNTVPQSVRLSVDLRHPDDGMLDRMEARLVEVGAEMAGRFNIDHAIARRWNSPPVTFDARAVAAVSGAVRKLCLSHREMVSGAGHDAVHVAAVAPTAMIFVPCQGGISHNPRESITSGQAASGANVLLQALLDYDEMETP
jgi:N-carbamoyl-L-amino-acid hydrolase